MSILSGIFSGAKKENKLALVFDFGSSSVGGALFLIQKSKVPKIIFSVREPIILEDKVNPDRFLSLTIKALEIVASKICLAGLGVPEEIFCVLSSPWYASQTRHIRFQKNKPFVFNSKLADDLIQKEMNLFKEEHLSGYVNSGNKVRQIELKSMKIVLNGYFTSKPIDQTAKELEMMIFISMSGEQVLEKIEEVVFHHFHLRNIKYSSFVITSFSVARDLFVQHEDFLLIDIGGEITDISMIKRDALRESVSFPLGRNFMVRGVASLLKCTLVEAKSLLSLYKDGHAEIGTLKKLEPIVNKLKTEWLKDFQKSLANLSNDISIPAIIFITVDQDLAEFFSEIIKTEQFSQYTLAESKFQVIFLDTKTLHGAAIFEENIIRDPFLIIEAIYINRFLC